MVSIYVTLCFMTGDELKQRREKLGLTQQELAVRLNNSAVRTVQQWEQLKDKEISNKLLEIAFRAIEREILEKSQDK